MQFIPTTIPDVILLEPQVFFDSRGFFMETYQAKEFAKAGIPTHFVQDNHSGSKKGVLRGLHYQIHQPQGKLIRVTSGEIFDVVVDLRKESTAFGKWVGTVLSSENRKSLWVPPGFAHGFYVLSDWAEIIYKATNFYAPQWERTLLWNDPKLEIDWPLLSGMPPILSTKDCTGKLFMEAEYFE